jgi:hypothetical protein
VTATSIRNGAATRTGIPYLADQENLRRSRTAGQRYASAPRPEKSAARNSILSMLTRRQYPATLGILTMPGMAWSFERALLQQREPASVLRDDGVHCDKAGRVASKTKRTAIARCDVIGRAWAVGRVRDLLTVTTTPARTSQPLKQEIDAAGGIPAYLSRICGGAVIVQALPYRDTMPMLQVTLARGAR